MKLSIQQARSHAKVTVAHASPMHAWLEKVAEKLWPPETKLQMAWTEWTACYVRGLTPEQVAFGVTTKHTLDGIMGPSPEVTAAIAAIDSVFVVQERHELDGAAWFEPVIAYFVKEKAVAEAARRQEIAMKEFVALGDKDDWHAPRHEVKEVMMGGA